LQTQGRATPLDDVPETNLETAFYVGAFNKLSASRQSGMNGGMAITIVDINAYCEMFSVLTDKKEFLIVMQSLDREYLRQQKRNQKNG